MSHWRWGLKTPGARRKTHVGRPLTQPQRHRGLWEREEVQEEAGAPGSSAVIRRAAGTSAGSLRQVRSSGPWVAPVTLHRRQATVSWVGAARGRSGQRGRGWDESPLGGWLWRFRVERGARGRAEAAGDPVPRRRDGVAIEPPNPLRAGAHPGGGHRPRGRRRPTLLRRWWRSWRGSWTWRGGQGAIGWAQGRQLETLESAPTPLGAAAAAT